MTVHPPSDGVRLSMPSLDTGLVLGHKRAETRGGVCGLLLRYRRSRRESPRRLAFSSSSRSFRQVGTRGLTDLGDTSGKCSPDFIAGLGRFHATICLVWAAE
jgi:hypothetical protein